MWEIESGGKLACNCFILQYGLNYNTTSFVVDLHERKSFLFIFTFESLRCSK